MSAEASRFALNTSAVDVATLLSPVKSQAAIGAGVQFGALPLLMIAPQGAESDTE